MVAATVNRWQTTAERLVSNFLPRIRRTTVNGKEFIVAPMSLIVPGVLNGSQGALYYPPDEVASDAHKWNRCPLLAYHPFANGQNASAKDPGVIDNQGIGFVAKATANGRGKLTAEGWFDVDALKRINPSILNSLVRGKPIELSTGLYTDNEPAPMGANHNGRGYEYIARNYRPDHVAILPDQVGACSLQDGCGVLVNKAKTPERKTDPVMETDGDPEGTAGSDDDSGTVANAGKPTCPT